MVTKMRTRRRPFASCSEIRSTHPRPESPELEAGASVGPCEISDLSTTVAFLSVSTIPYLNVV